MGMGLLSVFLATYLYSILAPSHVSYQIKETISSSELSAYDFPEERSKLVQLRRVPSGEAYLVFEKYSQALNVNINKDSGSHPSPTPIFTMSHPTQGPDERLKKDLERTKGLNTSVPIAGSESIIEFPVLPTLPTPTSAKPEDVASASPPHLEQDKQELSIAEQSDRTINSRPLGFTTPTPIPNKAPITYSDSGWVSTFWRMIIFVSIALVLSLVIKYGSVRLFVFLLGISISIYLGIELYNWLTAKTTLPEQSTIATGSIEETPQVERHSGDVGSSYKEKKTNEGVRSRSIVAEQEASPEPPIINFPNQIKAAPQKKTNSAVMRATPILSGAHIDSKNSGINIDLGISGKGSEEINKPYSVKINLTGPPRISSGESAEVTLSAQMFELPKQQNPRVQFLSPESQYSARAELVAISYDTSSVKASSDSDQLLDITSPSVWKWQISPKEKKLGKQVLTTQLQIQEKSSTGRRWAKYLNAEVEITDPLGIPPKIIYLGMALGAVMGVPLLQELMKKLFENIGGLLKKTHATSKQPLNKRRRKR